jgi:hypothetical protein
MASPTGPSAATMAMETRAAINPYSIAVAPDSSRRNLRRIIFDFSLLILNRLVPATINANKGSGLELVLIDHSNFIDFSVRYSVTATVSQLRVNIALVDDDR